MQKDIFKNSIRFNLLPLGRSKDCSVIIYEENPFKTDAFNFLNQEVKNFIKESFKKLINYDYYLGVHPLANFCLAKTNFQKINLPKEAAKFFRKIFKFLKDNKIEKFSIYLTDLTYTEKYFELIVVNFILANFEFSRFYKSDKNGLFKNIVINFYLPLKDINKFRKILKQSIIIGEEINRARFLSNLPGGDLTPSIMVDFIQEATKEVDLKVKILSERELIKIGAGGILGVARGSKEKPYLVIIENKDDIKEKKNKLNRKKEIHLIGKGITFDSGGLHLKPIEHINEMHMDISGAASAFSSSLLTKKLNIDVNLKTLIPLAENMISGESYRPGDILKTISGKTIEVGSTDAEGRIILADAIDYGKKFYHPDLIITIATLTGAAMIALGTRASALFSNNKNLQNLFMELSEKTWESLWPLPLWEEYKKEIEASFADILNIGKTRWGGAIHGAVFLWEFAKPIDLVHLDIAPRMTAIDDDYLSKGSTGFGVYLLKEFFLKFCQ